MNRGPGSLPRVALPARIAADALADRDPERPLVDLGGETMGTRWSVRLARPAGCDADKLRAALLIRLDELVAELSHWEPASALSRFNRAAAGSWSPLPADLATVVAAGLDLAQRTGGAFDPAIGPLVAIWGHGPDAATMPPDDAAITRAHAASGFHRLDYDPAARRLRQSGGCRLDLSGIAKGFAVDALGELLARHGIRHFLAEIGGELIGRGLRPDGAPWWVELESPPAARIAPFRLALHEAAVATSGDYVQGAHTIDPRSGRPTPGDVATVSVIHDRAMLADAWATALTVLGPEAGPARASAEGLAARFVLRDGANYYERLTPMLAEMLEPDDCRLT